MWLIYRFFFPEEPPLAVAAEPNEIVQVRLPAPLHKVSVPTGVLPGVYAVLRCVNANNDPYSPDQHVSMDIMDKIVSYAHRLGAHDRDLGELLNLDQLEAALGKFDELADVAEQMRAVRMMPLPEVERFVRGFVQ